jgi:hypothetical protein
MRALASHRRAATAAIMAASLTVLAACNAKNTPSTAGATPTPPPADQPATHYAAGTILISDGTEVVTIGDQKVTFPTKVKDAVWAPDGSRIAFIDADGNLATARPDGTGLIHPAGVGKTKTTGNERPAWYGSTILYTGWVSGKSQIQRRNAAETAPQWQQEQEDWGRLETGSDFPQGEVRNASASYFGESQDPHGRVAYEHETAKGDEVWVLDYNQREPSSTKIADGTEPALSPDGSKVAFVGRNGQVQVAPAGGQKHPAKQVTFGAATPSHLVWTTDGARIAYSTPAGVQSVAAVPAGAKSNPAEKVTDKPASVSYLLGRTNSVQRISGDPVAAALKASQLRWPTRKGTYGMSEDRGPAAAVVLASATQPDLALAASAFARDGYGPLLLTSGKDLDPAVRDEIKRLLGTVEGKPYQTMVYIVGDVSKSAESELLALNYATKRFTGTPSELFLAAAKERDPSLEWGQALVLDATDTKTTALAVADAGMPVLLADSDKLSDPARAYLRTAGEHSKIYTIGDRASAAVAPLKISGPKAGDTWYKTSAGFAGTYMEAPVTAVVADGDDPLTLAIAVSTALSTRSPLLLSSDAPLGYLDTVSGSTETVYIVGSATPNLADEVSAAIG